MKNSIWNMVLVLGGISLIAAAGVGYVYKVTAAPIAAAAEANKKAALGEVLPAFDKVSPTDLTLDGIPVTVHTAYGTSGVVGYAVETATMNGFSGQFKLMVGFTTDGKVRAVKVLEHAETPGLGSKMTEAGNPLFASFEGRSPADMNLAVRKDGGDVDALTAATITSRAYVDAVARAFNAMIEASGAVGGGVDASSGATSQNAASESDATSSESDAGTQDEISQSGAKTSEVGAETEPQMVGCSIAGEASKNVEAAETKNNAK